MKDVDLRETLAAWFKDSGTNDTMAARGAVYGVTIVPADDSESKQDRARRSLAPLSRQRLAKLARDIGRAQGAFGLEDQGLRILEESLRPITEITRRDIARCFGDDLSGERDVVEMVRPLFPLSSSLDMLFASTRTLADEIHQHMTFNPGDWSVERLFDQIGALDCPIDRFGRLLEAALHPSADGKPSLDLYGQMVAADRELRLVGYEVYRFGAKELVGQGAETVIATFFDGLLRRHGLQPSPDGER